MNMAKSHLTLDKVIIHSKAGNRFLEIAQFKESGREENFLKAIQAYRIALRVYSFDEFPIEYADINICLGNAYRGLSEVRDKKVNLKLALKAYDDALRVYTPAEHPQDYARVTQCIDSLAGIIHREKKKRS